MWSFSFLFFFFLAVLKLRHHSSHTCLQTLKNKCQQISSSFSILNSTQLFSFHSHTITIYGIPSITSLCTQPHCLSLYSPNPLINSFPQTPHHCPNSLTTSQQLQLHLSIKHMIKKIIINSQLPKIHLLHEREITPFTFKHHKGYSPRNVLAYNSALSKNLQEGPPPKCTHPQSVCFFFFF